MQKSLGYYILYMLSNFRSIKLKPLCFWREKKTRGDLSMHMTLVYTVLN